MAPLTAAQLASGGCRHWLFKSEPEPRFEDGKDVSFSIEAFKKVGEATWDGVRNPQASGFMKTYMKLGDLGLFYHSSCKVPGVAGLGKVSKESHPDHTAFDPKSPYYAPATSKDEPRWYMVNLTYQAHLKHFVPLSVLQKIAAGGLTDDERGSIHYLTDEMIESIAGMPLLQKGRLSVQPVPALAYDAICLMGEKGGFDDWYQSGSKAASKGKAPAAAKEEPSDSVKAKKSNGKAKDTEKAKPAAQKAHQAGKSAKPEPEDAQKPTKEESKTEQRAGARGKRKSEVDETSQPVRRSTRTKK